MSRLTRDGAAEPFWRDQILRCKREQGNIHPCSADHEQDWQPYPVDPYSCYMCDRTYIQAYSVGGGMRCQTFFFFFLVQRARDWPPCKVVFSRLQPIRWMRKTTATTYKEREQIETKTQGSLGCIPCCCANIDNLFVKVLSRS